VYLDVNELAKDIGELDGLADLYAAMIGAQSDDEFQRYAMIDVTPSSRRALLAPRRNGAGMNRNLDDLDERLSGASSDFRRHSVIEGKR